MQIFGGTMKTVRRSLEQIDDLSFAVQTTNGIVAEHARAIARVMVLVQK
jgi:hypothetical protein